MNILLVYKEADIATYKMLEGLSKLEDFNIYIASPQSYTDKKIYGNCTPLDLPVITSKFKPERYSCPAQNHQDLSDRPYLLTE
ncbi:hypothetical protein NXX40_18175 [Parabacteroides distasonis]|nr:hypothetical protein [Parabacteroides distasonis]